uniref:Uncharacterized protein n=1 Tax=Vitis vinifera TaxID=29760 RepID=F6I6L9_VITVI
MVSWTETKSGKFSVKSLYVLEKGPNVNAFGTWLCLRGYMEILGKHLQALLSKRLLQMVSKSILDLGRRVCLA